MSFDQIISLGYNCAVTELTKQFKIFHGNHPFEWIISSPKTAQVILSYLYVHDDIDDIVNKLNFISGTELNNISEFSMSVPHYTEIEFKHKMKRRIQRFYENLVNVEKKLLFVYAGKCDTYTEKIDQNNIIKISKLIQLYRPISTFRIVLIENSEMYRDSEYELYSMNNIDYIKIDRVDLERFWVIPMAFGIKKLYPDLKLYRFDS